MINRLLRFCALLFLVCSIAQNAWASFLSINSHSQFSFSVEGGIVTLSGEYTLENKGDEIAYEVYPSLEMGGWLWSGAPKNLEPQEKHTWKLKEKIPLADLECRENSACAGLDLPVNGRHPMRIIRHYKDGNGYAFSAADVQIVTVGEITPEQLARLGDEAIHAKLLFAGDGQEFTGRIELRNIRDAQIQAAMSFHAPRELQVLSRPAVASLKREEIQQREFEIKNFSGLSGSTYAVFVILQWQESGIRHTAVLPNQVAIGAAKTRVHLGWWLLLGVLSAALPLYWFVFRGK